MKETVHCTEGSQAGTEELLGRLEGQTVLAKQTGSRETNISKDIREMKTVCVCDSALLPRVLYLGDYSYC